ncbi:hypothetical protein D3C71_1202350 [compost metagenome]
MASLSWTERQDLNVLGAEREHGSAEAGIRRYVYLSICLVGNGQIDCRGWDAGPEQVIPCTIYKVQVAHVVGVPRQVTRCESHDAACLKRQKIVLA